MAVVDDLPPRDVPFWTDLYLGWVVHRESNRFIEDERERVIARLRPELRRQFRNQ